LGISLLVKKALLSAVVCHFASILQQLYSPLYQSNIFSVI